MPFSIDYLGTFAAETAMKAAAEYIRKHGLKVEDYKAATEAIRYHVKAALDQALADAKAAVECGMNSAAIETFRASMALAGISAAKEFGVAA